ncbi:MAG: Mu-like prophage major head subunit gpT family protein [Pseudomonadota bacterium]|nr:Mu-like prophage major head subunit gpT family protein [Pseudomonadota bacterium]
MSIINTSSFAKALWPGVNSWYGKEYNEYPIEFDKLFDKFTSRKNFEEDVGISSFRLAVVKDQGAPIQYDSERQGFTSRYTHVVWASGFIITREMMEDDLYDVVGQKKAQGLARIIRITKEINGANVYNRAFNSAFVGGDGVSLVNSAHPNIAGGTWSNTLATAADLSEAALEQAYIDISLFRDDAGVLIAAKPESLIIPPQLEFEATRILKSQGRVGTDNNDVNALVATGKFSKGSVVNHFLTDPDAWFIRTDIPNGMKYFERRPDDFAMDNDFDTENAKFKATSRYSFGWTDARAMYASPGA